MLTFNLKKEYFDKIKSRATTNGELVFMLVMGVLRLMIKAIVYIAKSIWRHHEL